MLYFWPFAIYKILKKGAGGGGRGGEERTYISVIVLWYLF